MPARSRLSSFFFLAILSLLLSSCDAAQNIQTKIAEFKKSPQEKAVSAQQGRPQQASRGVTLKPPYTQWTWNKRVADKLSILNAVSAVTRQAGVRFNQDKSYRNTMPQSDQWTQPNFENKPWKEALEDILAPIDLTFVTEGLDVVLITKEDAARRERQLAQLDQGLDTFLADLQPCTLNDAVIILPLLNFGEKTTEMGTLLSELSMLKAAYLPEKTLNIHLPTLLDVYHDFRYDADGTSITERQREQVLQRFDTKDFATGTLELAGDGSYKIALQFNGSHGQKEFSASGTVEELPRIPQWISLCLYEYCGKSLSPLQEQYLNVLDVQDTSSLYELAELERNYWNGRRDTRQWSNFLHRNPDSVFGFYRLSLLSNPQKFQETINSMSPALRNAGDADFLNFLEADCYLRYEDYENAVPRLLALLKKDSRNEALYEGLDKGLMAFGLGEKAESLHNRWTTLEPDSYVPLFSQGNFYIDYAWNLRGSGWSWTVSEQDRQKMREKMRLAHDNLEKALDLYPRDPRIPDSLMSVCIGSGGDPEEMEKWFHLAVQIDPNYFPAYRTRMKYLYPVYYGDEAGQEMLSFVRQVAAKAPKGSRVPLLLADAHAQATGWFARRTGKNWKEYYQQPDVWKEIKQVYDAYLQVHPDSVIDRNKYAELAVFAKDYNEAVRQFQIIGTDIDTDVWSEKLFYECRREAFQKAK